MKRLRALAALVVAGLSAVAGAQAADTAVRARPFAPDVWFVQGKSAMGSAVTSRMVIEYSWLK